jgi:4-hydroxybenzoate polyprenyltransferase
MKTGPALLDAQTAQITAPSLTAFESSSQRGVNRVFALVKALRPRQWIKNGLLFVPLAFALNLFDRDNLIRAAGAFACFCALSSAGYLVNDVLDVSVDRLHPRKRLRPIAAGIISVPLAIVVACALAFAGIAGSFAMRPQLGSLAVLYLILTAGYTLWFKHVVLLDVFGLAGGFVVRAAAGAVAISVPISPWLYTATMLGALLIGLGKRRGELKAFGANAASHRRNLDAYSIEFLDQLILIISGAAVMTYALYTFSAENLPKDHSMMLTIPIVLYGLFRYLFLIRGSDHEAGGAPEDLLFRDRPLLGAVALWAAVSLGILYIAS